MYFAVFNVLECRHAVFNAVNRHVGIFRVVLRHGLEYAAGRREEARAAVLVRVRLAGKLNACRLEPTCQLVKSQNRVNYALVVLRLILFGNAGADKNGLCVRVSALYVLAVSLHGGEHVCKKRQLRRKIFLDEQVDRVAAGGDNDISRVAVNHMLIFCLDYCCADSGLLGVEKAELLERFAHRVYAHALIVCYERRSKADDDRVAALEQDFYFFGLVNYLLCILRTYDKALTAEDTFVADNICLIAREAYRLHRAMADTFIAVFTVGFFKSQAIHAVTPSLPLSVLVPSPQRSC